MREKNRIKRIINLISRIWNENPDLRLGQLLMVAGGFTEGDNFHREDNLTEQSLLKFVEDCKKK